MILNFSNGTNTNWSVTDQDGNSMNNDAPQGSWHYRRIDMSSFAGRAITEIDLVSESTTAAGSWNIYFTDIALVSTNGTVRPLYNRQTSISLVASGSSGVTGRMYEISHVSNEAQIADQTTSFYHSDHLGSSRMMSSVNGYPVWQGTYLPFGYEYNQQISVNKFKFTGYEHDDESGQENANLRQLSSQLARFTSPDPLSGAITNPQSLNKYSYTLNNPLNFADPSGARIIDGAATEYGGDLGFGSSSGGNCSLDGLDIGCSLVSNLVAGGAADQCPDNSCSGFAPVGDGQIAFVQFTGQAGLGGSGYQAVTQPIPDPSLPINQINAAYSLACQYASAPCGNDDAAVVRYVGTTYNVTLKDNPLDSSEANGYKDPISSFHDGADSYYIGFAGLFGINEGHVVDTKDGVEAHHDAFGPYNPLHWVFEALPSLFVNTRSQAGAGTPYTCSVPDGCHP